jgi:ABC-type nitrate/sulfonate/bicarbonate transport system substrate-binding protein
MMLQGKIDATLATEDNLLQLNAKNVKFSVLADLYENGVYTTGSDIATSRQLLKTKPQQLKAFIMALTEGTAYGRAHKDYTMQIYRRNMKIDDSKLLESMYKNYLLGTIPTKPFPREEALQNDIEDLSYTYPFLKGKKAADFLDLTLLKSLEEEGFFKRLYGK